MTEVHAFDTALVREPAASVVRGLRAEDQAGNKRGDPDFAGVRAQHAAYVAALLAAGVAVTVLPALEAFPDSVFVEDPALVFGEGAVLLRPGAASRAGEVAALAPVLRGLFDTVMQLPAPGFADGGDVLMTARGAMIGLSARTDRAGAEALVACLDRLWAGPGDRPRRRAAIFQTPEGVLHFKSACSLLDEESVLVTPAMARAGMFAGLREVLVAEGEEAAANALRVNDVLLVSEGYPRTAERLDRMGYDVVALPTSEVEKVDAGLSCMSLRWLRGR